MGFLACEYISADGSRDIPFGSGLNSYTNKHHYHLFGIVCIRILSLDQKPQPAFIIHERFLN